MALVWKRPQDFGDALGDPCLTDTLLFDPSLHSEWPRGLSRDNYEDYTGQSLDATSVLLIDNYMELSKHFGEQSDSDSAVHLPTHIFIRYAVHIPPDWFQHHLNTLSTLQIGLSNAAIPSLSDFLSRQPPHSKLHHLIIYMQYGCGDEDERQRLSLMSTLVQALNRPHCKIDGFVLKGVKESSYLETLLQPQLTSDGNVWCRAYEFQCLGFIYCSLSVRDIQVLAEMLQSPAAKLSELSLYGSCDFVENFSSLEHLAAALQHSHCKLTRLDIRSCSISEKGLKLLFKSLQDSQMPIRDFGLSISDEAVMSVLRGTLEDPDFHIKILRVTSIEKEEIAGSLAEALGGQHCKVRVLDLTLLMVYMKELRCFLQRLQQQSHKVQCLRFENGNFGVFEHSELISVFEHSELISVFELSELISVLVGLLSSHGCSLLWLECRLVFDMWDDPKKSKIMAEALEALETNYHICTFSFPWGNRAAEARASSLLERNRRYRSGGLLEQKFVKPHAAKLFICGHAVVGKTTLRKSLLKASTPCNRSCNRYLGCGSLLNHSGKGQARTRGMELHTLSFSRCGGERKQLVICDLAGQPEYHAFHHYFLSGSNKDLFLVVCKYDSSFLLQDLESQLEYWLRFIVCHRSSASTATKPKVIVLLNFFFDAENMNQISLNKCGHLLDKYGDEIDFGMPGEKNVFGIIATQASQVIPLLGKVENLLGQLLQNRPTIPKLCDEISSHILRKLLTKGRLCGMQRSRKNLFLHQTHLFQLYYQHMQNQPEAIASREAFQVALSELHNTGQIVFFQPTQGADHQCNPLVITDCEWFCRDLIGSLLAPTELRKQHCNPRTAESWIWDKEDVRQMLRNQKCEEKYLDEILIYLQNLELCYPITKPESPKEYLLFPALLRRSDVHKKEEANQDGIIFLGRRFKCEDAAKQLLPSGVFARLQVKLHDFCGNPSYTVRYGLICFSKDFVRVEVRFGGDTSSWEDRQWIDILISYPDNTHSWIADSILCKIVSFIHEMCQATERGCPTMLLKEWVLRDNSYGSEALPLDHIQDIVLSTGINGCVVWADGACIQTIQVLLPSELKQHATQQLHAVSDVQMEFSATDENNRGSLSQSCEVEEVSGLDESLQKLWQLISPRLDKLEANIMGSLQDIRNEIGRLANDLQQVERHIVSNCSTHLLTQLLNSPLPLYPYLTDADGKWQKLKSLVVGERMQLHFMCEEGPHEIKEQKGLTVVVKPAEWLVKIAPVLVPALRVFCCAARLAATVYLPGSSHVFAPSPDFLQSLGLSDDALQRQILPEALKDLVGGISNVDKLSGQPLEESEVRECMSDLLQGQDVNMRKDFLLRRVVMDGKGKRRIFWVCPEHIPRGQTPLKEENPFA